MSDVASEGSSGRFDVHSHLLPEIDDGCASLMDSIFCARRMSEAGYTHSFCTPHFWASYPNNTIENVTRYVTALQEQLDLAGIALKLYPGGEIGLRKDLMQTAVGALPSYGMHGKFALVDLWAEKLPAFFEPTIRWMQGAGLTVILAHPERMRAVQDDPELADYFGELGLLLQGNLQCLSDGPYADTRRTVERFLEEERYFMLGSDLHNFGTLPCRLDGLERARELVGDRKLEELTWGNPRKLLE